MNITLASRVSHTQVRFKHMAGLRTHLCYLHEPSQTTSVQWQNVDE